MTYRKVTVSRLLIVGDAPVTWPAIGAALGRLSAAKREDDLIKAAANPRFMQGYAA